MDIHGREEASIRKGEKKEKGETSKWAFRGEEASQNIKIKKHCCTILDHVPAHAPCGLSQVGGSVGHVQGYLCTWVS